jgi:hypothetical protein
LLGTTEVGHQLFTVANRIDDFELVRQGGGPEFLDSCLIHETRVEIADQLLVAAWSGLCARRGIDDRLEMLFDGVLQGREGSVVRFIRRNLGPGQPGTVYEPVQIILRPHTAVEILKYHAGAACGRNRRLG